MQLYWDTGPGLPPPRTFWFQPEDQGGSGAVMLWTGPTNWTRSVRGLWFRVRRNYSAFPGLPEILTLPRTALIIKKKHTKKNKPNSPLEIRNWRDGLEFAGLKRIAGFFEARAPKGDATPVVCTLVFEPLSEEFLTRR